MLAFARLCSKKNNKAAPCYGMSRGSLLYQVLFAIFLSNNYVHNLVWHYYHLFGSLAIEPSGGIGIG